MNGEETGMHVHACEYTSAIFCVHFSSADCALECLPTDNGFVVITQERYFYFVAETSALKYEWIQVCVQVYVCDRGSRCKEALTSWLLPCADALLIACCALCVRALLMHAIQSIADEVIRVKLEGPGG